MTTTMTQDDPNKIDEMKVHFEHKQLEGFRHIHVDGSLALWAPNGNLYLSPYVEHLAIPEKMDHAFVDGKILTGESPVNPMQFVREFEVGFVMSSQVAKGLRDLLDMKLKELGELTRPASQVSGEVL